ncbi:MAG: methyltransferase [Pelagimonas sp.]|nr:methyltransferase [Pelagimonas sp.]
MRQQPFSEADLSRDALLGGKVQFHQPLSGYRAGTDPVLLAASVQAAAGQSVLELGCGAAPALCCLGARVAGLTLYGIELQAGYADLARRNLAGNGLQGQIWQGDLSAPPPDMKALSFDHVIANPPYFEAAKRIGAQAEDRELARAGETPLADWVAIAAKRLKPKGYATFIQRAERLPDLLSAMNQHLGSLELAPLAPRLGRPPRLILVRARKDGRADFKFHAPLVIHAGVEHVEPGNQYTEVFRKVMEEGAALNFSA